MLLKHAPVYRISEQPVCINSSGAMHASYVQQRYQTAAADAPASQCLHPEMPFEVLSVGCHSIILCVAKRLVSPIAEYYE